MVTVSFEASRVMTLEHRECLVLELSDFESKVKARKFTAENKGKFVAELKKYKRKRSLNANSYFWLMAGKLAAALNLTTTEIYRGYITEIGDNYELLEIPHESVEKFKTIWAANGLGWICDNVGNVSSGKTCIRAFYGSSTYSSDQMNRLIQLVVDDCVIQGIEHLPKADIERMVQQWATNGQKQ